MIPDPTRRQFGQAVALLAAAPLAADEPKPANVVEALTEVVRLRHGKHLDRQQLRAVARSILRSQLMAESLRNHKLTNADEPAITFRADLP